MEFYKVCIMHVWRWKIRYVQSICCTDVVPQFSKDRDFKKTLDYFIGVYGRELPQAISDVRKGQWF